MAIKPKHNLELMKLARLDIMTGAEPRHNSSGKPICSNTNLLMVSGTICITWARKIQIILYHFGIPKNNKYFQAQKQLQACCMYRYVMVLVI